MDFSKADSIYTVYIYKLAPNDNASSIPLPPQY